MWGEIYTKDRDSNKYQYDKFTKDLYNKIITKNPMNIMELYLGEKTAEYVIENCNSKIVAFKSPLNYIYSPYGGKKRFPYKTKIIYVNAHK